MKPKQSKKSSNDSCNSTTAKTIPYSGQTTDTAARAGISVYFDISGMHKTYSAWAMYADLPCGKTIAFGGVAQGEQTEAYAMQQAQRICQHLHLQNCVFYTDYLPLAQQMNIQWISREDKKHQRAHVLANKLRKSAEQIPPEAITFLNTPLFPEERTTITQNGEFAAHIEKKGEKRWVIFSSPKQTYCYRIRSKEKFKATLKKSRKNIPWPQEILNSLLSKTLNHLHNNNLFPS